MSRPIKFRVWDAAAKQMLHWSDEREDILDAIPYDEGDEWTERCVVEQFTGLLDSKGVEIYEGDIIRCEDGRFEVIFHVPSGAWVVLPESWLFDVQTFFSTRFDHRWILSSKTASASTVLGNIHEHPHLLS